MDRLASPKSLGMFNPLDINITYLKALAGSSTNEKVMSVVAMP